VLAQGENGSLQDGNIGMSQDQTSEGQSTAFNPEEIIKKEARGLGDADLGEVQEVTGEFIVTQEGTIDKDVFYIPKNLVDHFDGSTVFFTVTEEEVKQYKRETLLKINSFLFNYRIKFNSLNGNLLKN
jgi:hypothetical protein